MLMKEIVTNRIIIVRFQILEIWMKQSVTKYNKKCGCGRWKADKPDHLSIADKIYAGD